MSLDSVFIVVSRVDYEGDTIVSVHSSEMLASAAMDAYVPVFDCETVRVDEWSLDGRKDAVFEAEMVDFIGKIKGSV